MRLEQPATPPPGVAGAAAADVMVFAPAQDAALTVRILEQAGFSCRRFESARALLGELTPQAGVLLLAEELLDGGLMAGLAAALRAQPAWSDMPVVLVAHSSTGQLPWNAVAALGNVAMLQRPMVPAALASAVASALRARRRQWQVRDLLRQQREQAERKDQFLAMLAHELRNPLAPIRYAAHLLQRPGIAADRQQRLAELVDRQVGHMGRIIDQLLDVSRLTRGLIRLERGSVDLCALVRDALAAHAISAQAKDIVMRCDSDGAVHVDGDATRLRQVMDNLIDNAIKFSPPGTTVQVGIAAADGKARITVQDEGDGIERELQPLLFDAFVQSDRSLERSRGGLGLGLSLVKGMVDLHGGRVWVASDGPGTGSLFTVELPTRRAPARDEPLPATTAAGAGLRRVLLAEDNVDAAEAMKMILEGQGCEVHVVHSGPAAVEALDRLRPEVLVCDIGLPGLSGYGVARAAAAGHRPALMVALTGYGSPEDRANAAAAGFDTHLAKPVDVATLLRTLSGAPEAAGST